MKGKYYAEVYDGQRRRSLSLRTDNLELALQRYGAGMKQLARKIREEHEAAKPKEKLTWLPEELDQIRAEYPQDLYTPQEMAEAVTGHRDQTTRQESSSMSRLNG